MLPPLADYVELPTIYQACSTVRRARIFFFGKRFNSIIAIQPGEVPMDVASTAYDNDRFGCQVLPAVPFDRTLRTLMFLSVPFFPSGNQRIYFCLFEIGFSGVDDGIVVPFLPYPSWEGIWSYLQIAYGYVKPVSSRFRIEVGECTFEECDDISWIPNCCLARITSHEDSPQIALPPWHGSDLRWPRTEELFVRLYQCEAMMQKIALCRSRQRCAACGRTKNPNFDCIAYMTKAKQGSLGEACGVQCADISHVVRVNKGSSTLSHEISVPLCIHPMLITLFLGAVHANGHEHVNFELLPGSTIEKPIWKEAATVGGFSVIQGLSGDPPPVKDNAPEHSSDYLGGSLPLDIMRDLTLFYFSPSHLQVLAATCPTLRDIVRDVRRWRNRVIYLDDAEFHDRSVLNSILPVCSIASAVTVRCRQLCLFTTMPNNVYVSAPLERIHIPPGAGTTMCGFRSAGPLMGRAIFDVVLPPSVCGLYLGVREWRGALYRDIGNVPPRADSFFSALTVLRQENAPYLPADTHDGCSVPPQSSLTSKSHMVVDRNTVDMLHQRQDVILYHYIHAHAQKLASEQRPSIDVSFATGWWERPLPDLVGSVLGLTKPRHPIFVLPAVTTLIHSYAQEFEPDVAIEKMKSSRNWPRPEYMISEYNVGIIRALLSACSQDVVGSLMEMLENAATTKEQLCQEGIVSTLMSGRRPERIASKTSGPDLEQFESDQDEQHEPDIENDPALLPSVDGKHAKQSESAARELPSTIPFDVVLPSKRESQPDSHAIRPLRPTGTITDLVEAVEDEEEEVPQASSVLDAYEPDVRQGNYIRVHTDSSLNTLTARFPNASENLRRIIFVAASMASGRIPEKPMLADVAALAWMIEGGRHIRVHKGFLYIYNDDGSFLPFTGIPSQAVLHRVSFFFNVLEGVFRRLRDTVRKEADALANAIMADRQNFASDDDFFASCTSAAARRPGNIDVDARLDNPEGEDGDLDHMQENNNGGSSSSWTQAIKESLNKLNSHENTINKLAAVSEPVRRQKRRLMGKTSEEKQLADDASPTRVSKEVQYHYSNDLQFSVRARRYSEAYAAQSMSRRLQSQVVEGHTVDLDICNCCVSIVHQVIAKLQPTPALPTDLQTFLDDLARSRQTVIRRLGLTTSQGKQLINKMLNGGAAPDSLKDNEDIKKLQRLSLYLRWIACNVLHADYLSLADVASKTYPSATIFSLMWTCIEDWILDVWTSHISHARPAHISLHFDGVRVSADVAPDLGEFIDGCRKHILDVTGFDVEIARKQPQTVFQCIRDAVKSDAGARQVPDLLCREGHCIPCAMWHAFGGIRSGVETLVKKMQEEATEHQPRYLKYGALADDLGISLCSCAGLPPDHVKTFLLHAENNGRPHCVAAQMNTDGSQVSVFDGSKLYKLGIEDFKNAVSAGTDTSTVACFWQKKHQDKQEMQVVLLQLEAGASSDDESCSQHSESNSQTRSATFWVEEDGLASQELGS
ncbi:unnamed protein product [Symbiodinium natans]|uniref:F-box domain-containing protein n=1 Tax=Symbiodinium natans TaxID=878477 RepID=A0A812TZS9_9DINO|nr:unnamed protein product [Symbiodinium natans]